MKGLGKVQGDFPLSDGKQSLGETTSGSKGIIRLQGGFQGRNVQPGNDFMYAFGEGFRRCGGGAEKQKHRNHNAKDMICASNVCMTGSDSAMSITRPASSTLRAKPSSLASRQVWAAKSISRLMPPIFSSCAM